MTGKRARLLSFPWLLLTALTTQHLALARPAQGEGFALVVGVNECPGFELPEGSRPKPLKGAEHDAEVFADLLINQFQFPRRNVMLVRGEEATSATLQAKMRELAERIHSGDSFVFHFSGHGTQVNDRRPFDEIDGLDEALCLYDATAAGENLLVDDELGRWLDEVPAKNVTAILDCCHAGTGTKDVDADVMPRYLPLATALPKHAATEGPWRDLQSATKSLGRSSSAFFACRPDQQAYERRMSVGVERVHAGQFSHYLLEGLRSNTADADGNGIVSNEEAAAYAARRLDETFNRRREPSADRQEPLFESDRADAPLFGLNK